MKVLRRATIGLLAVTATAAQTVLDDPQKVADAKNLLDTFHGRRVGCDVQPGPPRLTFSLRLQSGYFWHLHLSPSEVAAQKWIVLARVTPKGGNRSPVYRSDVVQFPQDGNIGWETEVGHFWVGEADYAVKFLMFDDSGRACRKEWQVEARLGPSERKITPLLPPNSVAGASWSVAPRPAGAATSGMNRLTILLDVADQARTADQVLLMDALTALMEELPARRVRLVLFDLTQRKEIFRRDDFTSGALPEVDKAMRAVQFEPVDVGALQSGGVDLIENLANQEVHSPEPSDAVVFLGIPSFYNSKPSANFGQSPGTKPRFFYVLCPASRVPRYFGSVGMQPDDNYPGSDLNHPPLVGMPGTGASPLPHYPSSIPKSPSGPDSIEYAVDQLGGRTLRVESPDAFLKAIAEIAHTK